MKELDWLKDEFCTGRCLQWVLLDWAGGLVLLIQKPLLGLKGNSG